MTYYKFSGWEPDTDPTTPGIITDCQNLVPTLGGFKSADGPLNAGLSALAANCKGASIAFLLDDTNRLFAGTQTHLYERSGTSWSDVTRASGGNYSGSVDNRWRFAQFGNVTIATNAADNMQFSNASGAFADIGGNCPKAAIIETAANFVLAFDTNETTDGELADRWACSGLGDYTHWAAIPPSGSDAAAQAAFGRLLNTAGRIKAARKLGDDIIVYKERSMYLMRYIGPPFVWGATLLPGEIGAPCQEAVVTTGVMHFFVGPDDFYVYDGTLARHIPNPLRKWFFANLNQTYRYRIQSYHDRRAANIYWYFPSNSSSNGTIDSGVVYNYRENKWGRADRSLEAVVDFIANGVTWDGLGTLYSTWNDLPAIPYDSSFWTPAATAPAYFDTSHQLQTLNGAPASCQLTTHEMGDDNQITAIDRFRPRFLQPATSGALTLSNRLTSSDMFQQVGNANLSSGKFDLMDSSRWHKAQMNFTGPMEITGFDVSAIPEGTE